MSCLEAARHGDASGAAPRTLCALKVRKKTVRAGVGWETRVIVTSASGNALPRPMLSARQTSPCSLCGR